MNKQQRYIVVSSLVLLATFVHVLTFEISFVEYCVYCDGVFHHEHGPDVLFFRAGHRTAKYDKEYLVTVAKEWEVYHTGVERKAKASGMTFTGYLEQHPPGLGDR